MTTDCNASRATPIKTHGAGPWNHIGTLRKPASYLARDVARLAVSQGEVSVLLGRTGNVVVIGHAQPGYREAVNRHGAMLLGVYRDDPESDERVAQAIVYRMAHEDIVHAKELSA